VLRVAHRVAALLGEAADVVLKPLPTDDPRRRRPNIARAAALLGWKPTTPLDVGLGRTIAYFRDQLAPAARLRGGALPREKIVSIDAARTASA
jgi:UDP-glucuronate decarboxylase